MCYALNPREAHLAVDIIIFDIPLISVNSSMSITVILVSFIGAVDERFISDTPGKSMDRHLFFDIFDPHRMKISTLPPLGLKKFNIKLYPPLINI